MKGFLSACLVGLFLIACSCFVGVDSADAQQCNVQNNAASAASASSASALQTQAALGLLQQLSVRQSAAPVIVAQPNVRQFSVQPLAVIPGGASASASTSSVLVPPTLLSTQDSLNSLALLQQLSALGASAQPSASASAASSGGGGRILGGGILRLGGGRSFSRSVSVSRSR